MKLTIEFEVETYMKTEGVYELIVDLIPNILDDETEIVSMKLSKP